MTLGERIYTLRNQRKMSQGDLGERMGVSRQSISKWETDTSVPELEKLIKLSEIFNITLDELAKGDIQQIGKAENDSASNSQPEPIIVRNQINTKKVVGIILVCFGTLILLILTILGGFLSGLLFSAPFLLCGTICLVFKKNVGLWCAWAVFFTVNIYLRYATGISWRLTLFTPVYEQSMNYLRLLFAWIELLLFVAMIVITVCRFKKQEFTLETKLSRILYFAGWVVFGLLFIPFSSDPISAFTRVWFLFADWLRVGLLTVLLIVTVSIAKKYKGAEIKAFFSNLIARIKAKLGHFTS